jgi:hypothetical protein
MHTFGQYVVRGADAIQVQQAFAKQNIRAQQSLKAQMATYFALAGEAR